MFGDYNQDYGVNVFSGSNSDVPVWQFREMERRAGEFLRTQLNADALDEVEDIDMDDLM